MLRFLFLMLIVFSISFSEGYNLILDLKTQHYINPRVGKYNNKNNLVGIEREFNETHSISVLYFKNSYFNDSCIFSYNNKTDIYKGLKFVASVGVCYGYKQFEEMREEEKDSTGTVYIKTESLDHTNFVTKNKISPMALVGFEYKYFRIMSGINFYNIQLSLPIR